MQRSVKVETPTNVPVIRGMSLHIKAPKRKFFSNATIGVRAMDVRLRRMSEQQRLTMNMFRTVCSDRLQAMTHTTAPLQATPTTIVRP